VGDRIAEWETVFARNASTDRLISNEGHSVHIDRYDAIDLKLVLLVRLPSAMILPLAPQHSVSTSITAL